MVERGELRLGEPLYHRENRAVDDADLQIGVGVQQLLHPLIVPGDQVNGQRTRSNLVEHRAV